ncbi:MAG: hypothetical protein IBX50_07660 [Marinospirillum sp.]|uniref:hypothetical protein n=1 Tax=Marinospirillum sp. TaxID=2183934 RepID=UPI001A0EFF36|nr:hypothetical protein [Marinospirillum sp.]MBE0506583.1 hypothetical protein [Marinospirillum sp.]
MDQNTDAANTAADKAKHRASFAKTAESSRSRKGVVQPIGIVCFVDKVADQALVFDDETPGGRMISDPSTLASDTRYVSNIEFNEFRKDEVWRALHDGLVNEGHFRIRLIALIKELGGNPNNTAHWKILAPVIRRSLSDALVTAGYDYRERNPWESLCQTLTKGWGSNKPSFPEDVAGDLASTGAASWVSVHTVRSATRKTFINLQGDRYVLGRYLLAAKVPVGDWARHDVEDDDEISINDLLNLRSADQDIVVRVRITERISGEAEGAVRLPGTEETGQPRMYLTGPELAAMDKGVQDFQILHYFIGPVKALSDPFPPTKNEAFQGSLALDIAVRARKMHPAFGFWLSILERLWIYERVRELSVMDDVEINGFGSGKISIKIPSDTVGHESALESLMRFGMRHHLYVPVPLEVNGELLERLLGICNESPLRSAVIGAPELLTLFDQAMSGSDDEMERAADKISDVICARIEAGLDPDEELDDQEA